VRLWLSLIAYNLGNLGRRLVLLMRIDSGSLTSLQQRLVRTGGPFDEACPVLPVAAGGSHLTCLLFGNMLRRIPTLPSLAG